QPVQLFGGLLKAHRAWAEVQGPVRFDAGRPVPPVEQMAGRQLLYSLYKSVRTGNVVERQIVMEAGWVEQAGNLGMAEQRLQLRAEVDVGAAAMQVERLDPHSIPRQYQPPAGFGPQPDSKHAPQAREALDIPFEKSLEHDFAVAARLEPVT